LPGYQKLCTFVVLHTLIIAWQSAQEFFLMDLLLIPGAKLLLLQ